MKIKRILSQHRRDFRAIYECEHCEYTEEAPGYDDDNFHRNVIPHMQCPVCKKVSPDTYRPIDTKYAEHTLV